MLLDECSPVRPAISRRKGLAKNNPEDDAKKTNVHMETGRRPVEQVAIPYRLPLATQAGITLLAPPREEDRSKMWTRRCQPSARRRSRGSAVTTRQCASSRSARPSVDSGVITVTMLSSSTEPIPSQSWWRWWQERTGLTRCPSPAAVFCWSWLRSQGRPTPRWGCKRTQAVLATDCCRAPPTRHRAESKGPVSVGCKVKRPEVSTQRLRRGGQHRVVRHATRHCLHAEPPAARPHLNSPVCFAVRRGGASLFPVFSVGRVDITPIGADGAGKIRRLVRNIHLL